MAPQFANRAITKEEIRTCISNATLPLPGGIEITFEVRTSLDEMVKEAVSSKLLDFASRVGLVPNNNAPNPSLEDVDASMKDTVNTLIENGVDKINAAGPHHQFPWLVENEKSEEWLVEALQPYDMSSGPEPG